MLEITDLRVSYGRRNAVHDLSLTVGPKEFVCLIGPNGAGKTSTLRAVSGSSPMVGGTIRFMGADISKEPVAERAKLGISHVPQGRGIFRTMTVEENLLLGARLAKSTDTSRAYELFPQLHGRSSSRAGNLSGGELQMLAIGRAVLATPKLLLLDEPSMGLAPALVDTLFMYLNELKNSGVSVLLAEQRAVEALEVADRGYVIEGGGIHLEGASHKLLGNEEVQRRYLGVA